MGRWEWIILEIGFLGLLVWELVSVRRSIRRAKSEPGGKAVAAGVTLSRRPSPVPEPASGTRPPHAG